MMVYTQLRLVAIHLLCVNFSTFKFSEGLIQSLYENVHFFSLHTNGCSGSKVGTGIAVVVGTPVAEGMGSNGLLCSRCNHSTKLRISDNSIMIASIIK